MEFKQSELERILNIATVCIRMLYRRGGKISLDPSNKYSEPKFDTFPAPVLIIPVEWLNTATGEEIIHALGVAEWEMRKRLS